MEFSSTSGPVARLIGFSFSLVLVLFLSLSQAADDAPDPRIKEVQKLTDRALELQTSGKHDEAIGVWKRRLILVRSIILNENTEGVAGSLELLASSYELKGDYASAIRIRRDAFDIRKVLNGELHWKTSEAKQAIHRDESMAKFSAAERERLNWCETEAVACFRLTEKGKFAEACERFQPVIAEQKRLWGTNPAVAQSIYNCASFAQRAGDVEQSLKWFTESAEIRSRLLGEHHPDTARSHLGLANTYFAKGDARACSKWVRRAMEGFLQSLGEDSIETLAAMKATGSYLMQEDLSQSAIVYRQVLQIERRTSPLNKPHVAASLKDLSLVQGLRGDFAAAIQSLEEAVELLNESNQLISMQGLQTVDSLSMYVGFVGNKQREEKINQIGNTIRTALVSPSPKSAGEFDAAIQIEQDIARNESKLGHYDIACEHLQRTSALLDQRRALDRSSIEEAFYRSARSRNLFALGTNQSRLGKLSAARKSLEESIQLLNNHSAADRANCQRELGLIAVAERRMSDAISAFDAARKGLFDESWKLLWTMSEREQLFSLQRDRQSELDRILGICFVDPADRTLISSGFEWHMNGTMLSAEVQAARTALDRISEKSRKEVDELRTIRSQKDRIAAQPVAGTSANSAEKTSSLQLREDELNRSLKGRELSHLIARWTTLDDVSKALPEGMALVQFARINLARPAGLFEIQAKTSRQYAAWVIRGGKRPEIHFVPLGDVSAIDAAIAKLTSQIAGYGQSIHRLKDATADELDAEAVTRQQLESLSKTVVEPIEQHLNGIKQLCISPDGALQLLPWNALISRDGRYLIERYGMTTIGSGRDLIRKKNDTTKAGDLVLVADPDFDSDPPGGKRSGTQPSERRQWSRLSGTADEADLILPFVKKYGRSEPVVYKGKQATRSTIMNLRNPQVLILITHGFYEAVPKSVTSYFERQLIESTTGIGPADDPLMRCGIVLAGANNDGGPMDQTRTILSGRDVLRLPLNGTRLVVLSACETAAGEIRQGEGLAGLSQAFQISGAEHVLSAQWSIPGEETSQIMSLFWAEAAEGKELAAALRSAQIRWIKTRRERTSGAAHPFYWAAFMMHGCGD